MRSLLILREDDSGLQKTWVEVNRIKRVARIAAFTQEPLGDGHVAVRFNGLEVVQLHTSEFPTSIDINGERVAVVTEGSMVALGREVEVIAVEGNRILVRDVDVEALQALDPSGYVSVGAELWSAELPPESAPVAARSAIRVLEVRGLTLLVEPLPPEEGI